MSTGGSLFERFWGRGMTSYSKIDLFPPLFSQARAGGMLLRRHGRRRAALSRGVGTPVPALCGAPAGRCAFLRKWSIDVSISVNTQSPRPNHNRAKMIGKNKVRTKAHDWIYWNTHCSGIFNYLCLFSCASFYALIEPIRWKKTQTHGDTFTCNDSVRFSGLCIQQLFSGVQNMSIPHEIFVNEFMAVVVPMCSILGVLTPHVSIGHSSFFPAAANTVPRPPEVTSLGMPFHGAEVHDVLWLPRYPPINSRCSPIYIYFCFASIANWLKIMMQSTRNSWRWYFLLKWNMHTVNFIIVSYTAHPFLFTFHHLKSSPIRHFATGLYT